MTDLQTLVVSDVESVLIGPVPDMHGSPPDGVPGPHLELEAGPPPSGEAEVSSDPWTGGVRQAGGWPPSIIASDMRLERK